MWLRIIARSYPGHPGPKFKQEAVAAAAPLSSAVLAAEEFIASSGPSLPFQGDHAVDAHTARAPAPPTQGGGSGLSYHVFRGAMHRLALACIRPCNMILISVVVSQSQSFKARVYSV